LPPLEYEHPKVWDIVDRSVDVAAKHGVAIAANTGWVSYFTAEQIEGRIQRLAEHGVQVVVITRIQMYVFNAVREVVRRTAGFRPAQASPRAGG